MIIEFSLSAQLGYFAGFMGFLLTAIVLTSMKGKNFVRISLAFVLINCSLMVILGSLQYSGHIRLLPHLIRLDSPLHLLAGPVFYFYIRSSLKMNVKFRRIHLLHLLPFFINLISFIPLYLSEASVKLAYYNSFMNQGTVLMPFVYLSKVISVWSYLAVQFYLFYKYLFVNPGRKNYDKHLASWIGIFIFIQIVCYTGLVLKFFFERTVIMDPYKFAIQMISFLLFSITIALLFFPRLLYGNIFNRSDKPEKYSNSKFSESDKDKLYSDWINYLGESAQPHLNAKLTLSDAAKQLDTNNGKLSQVINEKSGMNFNDYINTLRIEEAKRLLTSDEIRNLTIDAIASKSGFNSKSPFYAAFKKHTGLTPKGFMKLYE